MSTGKVILFKTDRGYGFIQPSEDGDNVYVHRSALEVAGLPDLVAGQDVGYDLHTENGKISAINIQIL